MISIHGLKRKEILFLEILYSLQTLDEVNLWISSLPPHDQLVCDSLIRIIAMECLDETVLTEQDTLQARKLLNQIRGQNDLH